MVRHHVGEKRVQSIGYDSESMILEVESTTGAVYHFHNVPSSIVADLMSTSAKERFILEKIAGVYQSDKVKDEIPEIQGWLTLRKGQPTVFMRTA